MARRTLKYSVHLKLILIFVGGSFYVAKICFAAAPVAVHCLVSLSGTSVCSSTLCAECHLLQVID